MSWNQHWILLHKGKRSERYYCHKKSGQPHKVVNLDSEEEEVIPQRDKYGDKGNKDTPRETKCVEVSASEDENDDGTYKPQIFLVRSAPCSPLATGSIMDITHHYLTHKSTVCIIKITSNIYQCSCTNLNLVQYIEARQTTCQQSHSKVLSVMLCSL